MNKWDALRCAMAASVLVCSSAQAALFRAYLASDGNDANPCTLQAPCRLLPAALNAVADGGEIWMLDSANFNTVPVNITKSVSILAVPGVVGSVVATGGNAINISALSVNVALRNLVVVPLPGGGGVHGISLSGAGSRLTVEHCLIAGLPNTGILATSTTTLNIENSTIRGNVFGVIVRSGASATVTRAVITGNSDTGIWVNAESASTTTIADISESTISGGSWGITVNSSAGTAVARASLRNSSIVQTGTGATAQSTAAALVTLAASNNVFSNNNFGLVANFTGSRILASGNTVSNNNVGLRNNGGLFEVAGNNAVRANVAETQGSINFAAPL